MRVYYINSGLQGCYFYRCFLPMTENGWDGDQTTMILDNQAKTPDNKSQAAQAADVVVFHRPDDENKLKLARLLKAQGKKIVFDNDDTYKDDGGVKLNQFMDGERMKRGLKTINETVDAFIREADLVTTTTEFLAEEYRQLNDNVVVLPNCIDDFYFDEPIKNETDKVRIGLTGSIAVTTDFDSAYKLMEETLDDERIQWVLYSLPKNSFSKIANELYHDEVETIKAIEDKIDWQGFTDFEQYYDTLNELALDIMCIPRADNYFNRCKSNLKFLEAAMFEVPVIAQGFPDGKSPYQVDPEDAEHMIIANNHEEFMAAINDLVDNPQKRIDMGKKARDYVFNKYNISDKAELWQIAYENLFRQKQS